jgi:pyruvate kinase
LALSWGISSFEIDDAHTAEDMVSKASATAQSHGFTQASKPILIAAGMPFGTPGSTNLLRVVWPSGQ